jgi:Concanavalin A-like lectin/glucanases superfamily
VTPRDLVLALLLLPRLALGACVGTDTYSNMICATGNVAHYWRMDAPSGTTETDHFGSGYSTGDLTYINTADVTLGTTGLVPLNSDAAVTFGGNVTNPGFALTNSLSSAELTPQKTLDYTLEIWFKPSSLSGDRYIATDADSLQYNFRLYASSSGGAKLRFLVWTQTPGVCNGATAFDLTATNAFSTGSAYYIIAESDSTGSTWAASGVKLYVNNVSEATATGSGDVCATNHRFYLGIEGQDRNGQAAGVIDDVAIYDRILTSQERIDHYQGFPTGASGAVRRIIEGKFNRPRIRQADRIFGDLEPIYLDETGPMIARINARLLTGSASQYLD